MKMKLKYTRVNITIQSF